MTDVIETDSGLYVGRLTSLLDREATDQEKENIVEQRRQEQYDSLLEEWRDAAGIEVNQKVWNKVDFDDLGVTLITSDEETTGDGTDGTSEDGTAEDSSTDAAADDASTDAAEDAGTTDDTAAEDGSTDTAGTDAAE